MAVEPLIEKLLVLQDRDTRCDDTRRQLEDIPREIARFRDRIAAEKKSAGEAHDSLKRLELRRREAEQRIAEQEATIVRFRTQQLSVKKNEEYTALEHEIETTQAAIGNLEGEALEAMMEIDDMAGEVRKRDAQSAETVAELEGHIKRLQDNEAHYRQELKSAEDAVAAAREGIPDQTLSVYRYVKERVKRPPYVTSVEDQRCMGCHIKVSHTVMASLRNTHEVSRCENCSRIVYLP